MTLNYVMNYSTLQKVEFPAEASFKNTLFAKWVKIKRE
jgi:hypothetical protein